MRGGYPTSFATQESTMPKGIKRGKFVAFDGMDGSGKGTQIKLLKRKLPEDKNYFTYEPGGTDFADKIRHLLKSGEYPSTPACDLLLFYASRASHLEDVVEPLLGQGMNVLSDRYESSTWAFQLYGEEQKSRLERLMRAVRGAMPLMLVPDAYFIFDLPAGVAYERMKARADEALQDDRFDAWPREKHERVRTGFQEFAAFAAETGSQYHLIDANRDEETIHKEVWGIPTSRVPGPNQRVEDLLGRSEYTFELDTIKTNVLKRGHLYVIELMEGCALPPDHWMEFSPKSSSGRCGIHVRVLCDKRSGYDRTKHGYHGPLYLEVDPFAFDVRVRRGISLVQGRVKNSETRMLVGKELRDLHTQNGLLFRDDKPLSHDDVFIERDKLYYHLDLSRPVVGLMARPGVAAPLDLTASEKDGNLHEPANFWIPILRKQLIEGRLPLLPGNLYLLSSWEVANIPSEACAQMTEMESMTGEFRTHYAGFFDPGFRNSAVFEVQMFGRAMELEDRSPVCSMGFEKMIERPDQLYGAASGSHYAGAVGPSLSKIFLDRQEAWTLPYWQKFFS